MLPVDSAQPMNNEHEIEIRVRYHETDGQGHVHHANYLNYFELGRVELLRANGRDYAELERQGIFLVVSDIRCRYYRPANFGDALRLTTRTVAAKGARVAHAYELFRGDELIAEGSTTVACVDATGRVRRLPPWLAERRDETCRRNAS